GSVVHAKVVWFKLPHLSGAVQRIKTAVIFRREIIAPRILFPLHQSSRCTLPFGFGPKTLAGPSTVGIGSWPAHIDYWNPLFTGRQLPFGPVVRGSMASCLDEDKILLVGYLVFIEIKGADEDSACRLVILQ